MITKKNFLNKYLIIVTYTIIITGLILHYTGIDTSNLYWLIIAWVVVTLKSLLFILGLIKKRRINSK